MTEHHRGKAPKLAVVAKVKNPLHDLETPLFDLHQMVQLTVMAAEHGDDVLTRFGVFQMEKMAEEFRRSFYELFEKHVGRQSA
jgi:hypothetical protein